MSTIKTNAIETVAGDATISVAELASINIKNLANGTLPTTDPGVPGQLWSNSGIVTVS